LQLQLEAIEKNIEISAERLKLENARFEVGKSNQLAAKQAQLDYNAMSSQRTTQINLINIEKIVLNQLLTREVETPFIISDTIILQPILDIETLKTTALKSNTELQILEKSTIISEASLKEVKAAKYPTISLNTAYGYNQTVNSDGFSKSTNNLGLTSGLTMRWNLFDGGRVRRNISNAQLQIENDKIAIQESRLNVNSTIQQAVLNFQNALSVAKLEEENFILATESINIVKERYRLGVANTLELKDAQNVFDQSTTRRALALYNAKVAEINLQFLTGQLAVQ
jgi:outer membrane protein TolC